MNGYIKDQWELDTHARIAFYFSDGIEPLASNGYVMGTWEGLALGFKAKQFHQPVTNPIPSKLNPFLPEQ